ncbi:hypothetical protein A3K29_05265 [Candidatus Collierbacteria bacterium RIFOXYB2_FULL_46_14]|nr:MAG: hypothetical protein A3K29_05265 [Candidatus Collierbacteria bacterium RIFOXYB2_FULL_46_14]OGD76545.1 MAG: hypothetical protein A3K43_05265 [Candidatus Collierbacteria bacterium RIFOXYA2_FULL_46_20]OGD77881.1 MAG: hypothetical protein A3K39_05265 [Candidatus Collierbacteria bacterium RIFOXYC2_FULL_43_15]OGD81171.1 MAG: hypothetical protein A2320_05760 [Pseudomonadales bacterium GWC2_63_15]OGD82603.1 MAG: hypothetical protein A3K36_05265 [Candidatus Collierbacteria bacterium RIFOXYD2_FUL
MARLYHDWFLWVVKTQKCPVSVETGRGGGDQLAVAGDQVHDAVHGESDSKPEGGLRQGDHIGQDEASDNGEVGDGDVIIGQE